jgi:hypothetical protein
MSSHTQHEHHKPYVIDGALLVVKNTVTILLLWEYPKHIRYFSS